MAGNNASNFWAGGNKIGSGKSFNDGLEGYGSERNDVPGLRQGVNHGKDLLSKKTKLKGEFNMPTVKAGGKHGFPVAVAPWNEAEADIREKTDVFTSYLKGISLPSQARVNFPVDTDALIQITKEKRGAVERLQFYEWLYRIMAEYGFSPDIVKFVKEHYPEYFEEQIALVEKNLEIQKRAAMMAIKIIPDSKEDLEFLYALNTGKIDLPDNVAYKPVVKATQDEMARGLLSVRGYGPTNIVPNNAPFAVMGIADQPFGVWKNMRNAGTNTFNLKFGQ